MSTEKRRLAISLHAVTKTYRLYRNTQHRLLEQLGWARPRAADGKSSTEFHALKDIDLTVAKGDRLGIIGRNGAGKTTLLKIITGNFSPTSGSLQVNGAVQALMQVGLGFHPEFSGYENIRSALLYNGLSARKLETALADVVDFVELGDFLHQPMKIYSQGMQARLQFATATAIDPDILIVDEVMGAGDAYFSAKSAARMKQLTGAGCTLLLVSHSAHQVLEFCNKAVWLHEGKVRMYGDAEEIIGCYEVYIEREYAALRNHGAEHLDHARGDDPHAQFTEILPDGHPIFRWPSRKGVKINAFRMSPQPGAGRLQTGADLRIEFDLMIEMDGDYGCGYFITIWDAYGKRIARVESPVDTFSAKAGDTRPIVADISPLLLDKGDYVLTFSVYDRKNFASTIASPDCRFDVVARCISFSVSNPVQEGQKLFAHPGEWTFTQHPTGTP